MRGSRCQGILTHRTAVFAIRGTWTALLALYRVRRPVPPQATACPARPAPRGAFGLLYCSGTSSTKGSNRSACLRASTENDSCSSGVTASSGAHRTSTLPAERSPSG